MKEMQSDRKDFNDTWLFESPEGVDQFDLADAVEYCIRDRINHGSEVINLSNNLKKIEGIDTAYYWYEDNGKMLLAVEFTKKPQALVVRMIGKYNKGKPPYASDLYDAVLKDRSTIPSNVNAIRIMSDEQLSDEGLTIWKRLLQLGRTISIYDANNPGQTYKAISSIEELVSYFKHDDRTYRRWQYVLTEAGIHTGETNSAFHIRRIRELSGRCLD